MDPALGLDPSVVRRYVECCLAVGYLVLHGGPGMAQQIVPHRRRVRVNLYTNELQFAPSVALEEKVASSSCGRASARTVTTMACSPAASGTAGWTGAQVNLETTARRPAGRWPRLAAASSSPGRMASMSSPFPRCERAPFGGSSRSARGSMSRSTAIQAETSIITFLSTAAPSTEIAARLFDPDGVALGGEFQISSQTQLSYSYPGQSSTTMEASACSARIRIINTRSSAGCSTVQPSARQ